MEKKRSDSFRNALHQANLSSRFFDKILELAVGYCGENLIETFKSKKRLRERYLAEKWDGVDVEPDLNVFREVDYDYLITLIRSNLVDSSNQLYNSHFELVDVCLRFGEYNKAEGLIGYLWSNFDFEDPKRLSDNYMLEAKLSFLKNNLEDSENFYIKSLDSYKSINDHIGLIKSYNNLGIISYERKWDTEKGKKYFRNAKKLCEETQKDVDKDIVISVQMNLAIIDDIQGYSERAYELFNELFNSVDETDTSTLYRIAINRGFAAKNYGDLDLAFESLANLFFNNKEPSNHRLTGIASLLIAEIYVRKELFSKAKNYLIQAFKTFSKLHDRLSIADTYRVFGMLYREERKYELAESQFQISLELNDEYGNLLNLSETHYEFSLLFKQQGDTYSQREHLDQAISYAREMGANKRVERLQEERQALG